MTLTEELVAECARSSIGTTVVEADGASLDLTAPWPRRPMIELIKEHAGVDVHPADPVAELEAVCDRLEVPREPGWGPGKLVMEIYEKTVEPNLVGPVFVTDYPRGLTACARTATIPRWSSASRWSRSGASSPTRSVSSTTRSISESGSKPKPSSRPRAMRKPTVSTRTMSERSSTDCRRVVGSESAWTGS